MSYNLLAGLDIKIPILCHSPWPICPKFPIWGSFIYLWRSQKFRGTIEIVISLRRWERSAELGFSRPPLSVVKTYGPNGTL